ncbi:hypothetical protein [Blastococcus sp. KM273128]|uniref:hypothetical protein n=1 Tax=Blastococcus sp. KM273128 TaxID=2570314 RepID=UPI001F1638CC|nr:hypothetical protein [Blastococcus sp. KM273128]
MRPAPDLRRLLAPRYRGAGERPLPFDPDATVGHLVQAAGIPFTEVGEVRVDGAPVPVTARVRPGAVLEVVPAPRPVAVPPGGFLLDVGLGALARGCGCSVRTPPGPTMPTTRRWSPGRPRRTGCC